MRKSLLVFLILVLTFGSGFTLAEGVALRERPTLAFGSPSALAIVRAYYAAVNHYIQTGEFAGVQAVVDPAVLGKTDLPGAEGGLELSLHALRKTYPRLRMTIQEIYVDPSTVIVTVAVDAGEPATFDRVRLRTMQAWRMTETFTVSNGRITSRWTSGPGLGLFLPLAGSPTTRILHEPKRATIARVTFQSNSTVRLPILAPASIVVERGELRMLGNGVTVVTTAYDATGAVTEPDREYRLRRNDTIVVPAGRTVLQHHAGEGTSLLITTVLPAAIEARPVEHRSLGDQFSEALNIPNPATTLEQITVEPLARSASMRSLGAVDLISGWIVLTPGGSVTLQDTSMEALIISLVGAPVIERAGESLTVLNLGTEQVVLWMLQIAFEE